jgi:hypothetical protein
VRVADLHPRGETVTDVAEERSLGERVIDDAEGARSDVGTSPCHEAVIVAGVSVEAGAPPSA